VTKYNQSRGDVKMATYAREQVKLEDILLDVDNPRFASYFERIGKDKANATQDDIIEYLQKYESINVLSERIKDVKGLHPTELIACLKVGDKYIVLEGNRRVCACKELYNKYYENPDEIDLVSNISQLEVVVYETRELAQPYISDKHIDGVKKWESIEKSCYYYRMFQEKRLLNGTITADEIVENVSKQTVSKKNDVKDCIIKYGFYMSVYEALATEYSREVLADISSFLPLVDRFMKILVSQDADVGLDLPLIEYNYVAHQGKEKQLIEIFKVVGEAFLVRKSENQCENDEECRINSQEVYSRTQQKRLITDDLRVPGLFALIKEYKKTPETNTDSDKSEETKGNGQNTSGTEDNPNKGDNQTSETDTTQDDAIYEPIIPWKPKQPQNKTLFFSKEEGKVFILSDTNDEDVKIKFIIAELSRLPIDKYPYSCTSLYRLLLEAVTKKAYDEKKPKENKNILTYDNKSLPTAVSKLAKNNTLKISGSERANVVEYVDKKRIIDTLNNYMHNPKQVDTEIILSSWITMKDYIRSCLT
jgi:hypothetical protein